jgi:hypothetical protein
MDGLSTIVINKHLTHLQKRAINTPKGLAEGRVFDL